MDVTNFRRSRSPTRTAPSTGSATSGSDKPVIVVFLRHFGCHNCRDHAVQLRDRYDDLQAQGIDLVAIGTGDQRYAGAFVRDEKIPFLVLVDDDAQAAQAASVNVASWYRLLHPSTWKASIEAWKRGRPHPQGGQARDPARRDLRARAGQSSAVQPCRRRQHRPRAGSRHPRRGRRLSRRRAVKAVIFDFYGTLAETPNWGPSWQDMVAEVGYELPDDVRDRWWNDGIDGIRARRAFAVARPLRRVAARAHPRDAR